MGKLAINGGDKVRSNPFTKRMTIKEREKKAVLEVLDSGEISGFFGSPGPYFFGGKKVKEFEKKWGEKYNQKHCITVNSWTTGLMTAIGAIGIGPGDEVICPPYSMSATATSILFYGGIPVFVDIDPVTFNLDANLIEKYITPRTKAIMVVHLFGHPAEMDKILSLAKKYNLKVIEDAAHAPGVKYKNQFVGCLGDVGGFSLNYHKHVHTGEGGVIVTNNDLVAQKCQMIRNHGENVIDEFGVTDLTNAIGSNYRLTEMQAAIGISQLDEIESCITHRNKLHQFLVSEMKGVQGITLPTIHPNNTHAFYLYPIKIDENVLGLTRDQFAKAVMAELPTPEIAEQIVLAQGYVKPLYWNTVYQKQIAIGSKGFPFNYIEGVKYDYSKGICPVVERMHEKELMTTHLVRENMDEKDLKDFVRAIHKVVENRNEIKRA